MKLLLLLAILTLCLLRCDSAGGGDESRSGAIDVTYVIKK